MKEYEKYIDSTDFPGCNKIWIRFYYDVGNYLRPRAFYLRITPVMAKDKLITWSSSFPCAVRLISEVTRYSDKQYEEAKAKAMPLVDELINEIKAKYKKMA